MVLGHERNSRPGAARPSRSELSCGTSNSLPRNKRTPNFPGQRRSPIISGAQPGISVRSVSMNDPGQGSGIRRARRLSRVDLVGTRAARRDHAGDRPDRSLQRIKDGKLSLDRAALGPLVDAVRRSDERTNAARLRRDASVRETTTGSRSLTSLRRRATRSRRPDARLTPYASWRKFPDGAAKATVHLPLCCFPAYRNDGKPSRVKVLKPGPSDRSRRSRPNSRFAQTEMYDEPFHVPEPDDVILEERWASGEWFRSGAIWKLGKGRVFYFRPGHETLPIYKQPIPLRIVTNAVRWLGTVLG